jgi:hypothetical protein
LEVKSGIIRLCACIGTLSLLLLWSGKNIVD